MFWVKKATAAAFALCAVFALGTGVGLSTRTEHTGATAQEKGKTDPNARPPGAPAPADFRPKPLTSPPPLDARAKELIGAEVAVVTAEQKHDLLKQFVAVLTLERENWQKLNPGLPPRAEDAAAFQKAETQLKEVAAEVARLKEQLAKLKEPLVKTDNGYIELTISGKAGEFEFVIREVPPNDPNEFGVRRVYGPVTTRDPEMLAKLLARTKADPTGPQEARVIVQPQTVFGMGPRAALKACDAAGYKTVKFTGYVFGGGFAVELKADQTGDVRGYKRYDAVEVKPAELVKEIEEGMKRF